MRVRGFSRGWWLRSFDDGGLLLAGARLVGGGCRRLEFFFCASVVRVISLPRVPGLLWCGTGVTAEGTAVFAHRVLRAVVARRGWEECGPES